MSRFYLAFILIFNTAVAQQGKLRPIAHPNANKAVSMNHIETAKPNSSNKNIPTKNHQHQLSGISEAIIGKTYYDLQTNRSIYPRIQRYSDGTTAAVWITTAQSTGWTDRGTGYNYNNGTDLVSGWAPIPTSRIENIRTGFPNLLQLNNGEEVVIAHSNTQMSISRRANKGSGTWNTTIITGDTIQTFWPHAFTNGQTIHLFELTTLPYKGQESALLYSRSQDGGLNWDKLRSSIQLLDSSQYVKIIGDQYNADVKGNNVALVIGGYDKGCFMIKSNDGGDTWNKTDILPFPITKYNSIDITDINNDNIADTIETCDGSVNVVLDNNNNAHVFFGRMRVICNDTNGLRYFPHTDGMYYWNEITAGQPKITFTVQDLNGDGQINIPADTTKPMNIGKYYTSMTSHPSATINNNGMLYLTYSSIMEGTDLNGMSFRHSYLAASPDFGQTWCDTIIDFVTDPFTEGVYASIAPITDDHAHIVYQRDYNPGIFYYDYLFNLPGPEPYFTENDIVYVAIPLYTNNQNNFCSGVGVTKHQKSLNITISPNPASKTFQLNADHQIYSFTIYNSLGELISSRRINSNSTEVNIENYPPGLYFVQVTDTNGFTTTQKLVFE